MKGKEKEKRRKEQENKNRVKVKRQQREQRSGDGIEKKRRNAAVARPVCSGIEGVHELERVNIRPLFLQPPKRNLAFHPI